MLDNNDEAGKHVLQYLPNKVLSCLLDHA